MEAVTFLAVLFLGLGLVFFVAAGQSNLKTLKVNVWGLRFNLKVRRCES